MTTAFTTILTIFRGILRWRQYRKFYSDDYWSFAGQVFLIATAVHLRFIVPELYEQQRRLDGDKPRLSDAEYARNAVPMAKLLISILEMFWGCLWSVKLSFLMLIKRMLTPQRRFVVWWWITLVWTILMFIAALLSNFLVCLPLWRRWSVDPKTYCGTSGANDPQIALAISLVFDATSDVAIMVLPLYMLRGLRVSRSRRIAVQAMFALSTPVIIIAALRVALIAAAGGTEGGVNMYHWTEWTWSEPWIAMTIVHVPAFKYLFDRSRRFFNDSANSNSFTNSFHRGNKKRLQGIYSTGTGLSQPNESTEGLHAEGYEMQGKIGCTSDFAVKSEPAPRGSEL